MAEPLRAHIKEEILAKDVGRRAESEIEKAVWDIADRIFARSQRLAPVDIATLRKSGVVQYGENMAVISYEAPHAKPVHFGSRPHMPPVEPLIAWVRRNLRIIQTPSGKRVAALFKPPRGISKAFPPTAAAVKKPGEREAERVGWAVAKKIAREGTRAVPFLQRAIDEIAPKVPDIFRGRIRIALGK